MPRAQLPKGKNKGSEKRAKGRDIIPLAVDAALGAQSFMCWKDVNLSVESKMVLNRILSMDVDVFRREFSAKLRGAANRLLDITMRDLELIKPDARAYTLAVLIDKASALEGRLQATSSNVNVQINNYGGSMTKEQMLDALHGKVAAPLPLADVPPSISVLPQNPEVPVLDAEVGEQGMAGDKPEHASLDAEERPVVPEQHPA